MPRLVTNGPALSSASRPRNPAQTSSVMRDGAGRLQQIPASGKNNGVAGNQHAGHPDWASCRADWRALQRARRNCVAAA